MTSAELDNRNPFLQALEQLQSPVATIEAYYTEPDEPIMMPDVIDPCVRGFIAKNVTAWVSKTIATRDTPSIERRLALVVEKGIPEKPYDPSTYHNLFDFLHEWAPELDDFLHPGMGFLLLPEAAFQQNWWKEGSMGPLVD